MNILRKIQIGIALILVALHAQAGPITGSVDMFGEAFLLDADGFETSDASLATSVDFDPNTFLVVAAEGDLSPTLNQLGSIQDLDFDPFAGPVNDFWTVSDFSFRLDTVAREVSDPQFLVLNGTGVISHSGFYDTAATWSFSANTASSDAKFVWNAVSASVPEPSVLALLSIGLVGLGLRKKAA